MLTARNLAKQFPGGHAALAGVALDVRPGEIVALVGASGCGKSTLLRILAGLERPTTGMVALDGSPIAGPRPEIGLVFQEPRLMPWLTVAQNVGFGLADRPRAERAALVAAILERVGLQRAADAWPRALSGGMAQRAALARALVAQPAVLLLDEPFSALDPLIRADLQDHLLELWDATRPTLVVVTHDAEEALVLADRIAVMRGPPGQIATVLKPDLPRPRDRSSAALQAWRRRLLAALRPEIELPERGEVLVPAAAI